MNPTSRIWDIPPPPGTEDIALETKKELEAEPELEPEPKKEKSVDKEDKPVERPIDRFNPYLKNPEYVEYEKRRQERKQRSRSRDRHHRRRRSRSRSRDRHRRSRSRSRRRRRSSNSRSRSPSHHRRHKYSRRRSKSRTGSRRPKTHQDKKSRSKSPPIKFAEEKAPEEDARDVDAKPEEEDDDANRDNAFKNDGTFLEMFKKMQEQRKAKEEPLAPAAEVAKRVPPAFGKRRGGKVLKTGLVRKVRLPNEEETSSQDAWSVYMKEVRKYKEACCDDDSKTRPLVK